MPLVNTRSLTDLLLSYKKALLHGLCEQIQKSATDGDARQLFKPRELAI